MHVTVPLVSVVVPTYNHARYLPTCLDTIFFQDYPNIEILVINAASPDNTREVLEEYSRNLAIEDVSYARNFNERENIVERMSHKRYPQQGRSLKIFSLERDPGLSETYNIGLRAAAGEYIAPVVSDDMLHPEMISALVAKIESGNDFVYSDMWLTDDSGRIVRGFYFPEYDPKMCLADWYLMGVSRMWRRSLHEKAGFMDPAFVTAHDYDLILRFAEQGARFAHVPRVLYSLRWHGASRQTGNHTPQRQELIYSESISIAKRARHWLAKCR